MSVTAKIARILSIATVIAMVVVVVLQRQDIQDWYSLRRYTPSQTVVRLADEVGMTDYAKRVFYVNKPTIAEKKEFNNHCRDNEQTIVLGCYITGQKGIYLLNVTDSRLKGVQQVTAAHEMLHAAFERLSQKEKNEVTALLKDVFSTSSNRRIKDTINIYKNQDVDGLVLASEMHSILGTEEVSLNKDLEEYYGRYFVNRKEVVRFSESYESAFIDRKDRVRSYDRDLTHRKQSIDDLTNWLRVENTAITQAKIALNSLMLSDPEEYNRTVSSYNERVGFYNAETERLTFLISEYNSVVRERNDIVVEESELMHAIDSRDNTPRRH